MIGFEANEIPSMTPRTKHNTVRAVMFLYNNFDSLFNEIDVCFGENGSIRLVEYMAQVAKWLVYKFVKIIWMKNNRTVGLTVSTLSIPK